jgi:methanogenic corrinoid protein MtbC1
VVEQALTSGMAPEAVLVDLVSPAMTAVGDDWSTGVITVAQEHQASTIAMRLVGRLGPQFARRAPRAGG